MPWYKVPTSLYLNAETPQEAQDRAVEVVSAAEDDPDGPVSTVEFPVELTQEQVDAHRRLRQVLRQAQADSEAGLMVSDGRYPGVKFGPQAAAELAALEFEGLDPGEK